MALLNKKKFSISNSGSKLLEIKILKRGGLNSAFELFSYQLFVHTPPKWEGKGEGVGPLGPSQKSGSDFIF